MFSNRFVCFIFFILSICSCTPEDGFCVEEKHSGDDSFSCSQMDDHFSETGAGIELYYSSKKALYDGTFVLSGGGFSGSDNVIIKKPEYIPEVISIEKMTGCTIAPSIGGVDCNQWYSFDFLTTDGSTISFSSRKDDDFTKSLFMKFCTFKTTEIELYGNCDNYKIGLNDSAVIDGKNLKIIHRYTFVEK